MKKYLLIVIIALVVITGAYFSFKRTTTNQTQQADTQPTFFPIVTPSLLPLSSPTPVSTITKTIKAISGTTSGQISCNYQVPAAPNQFGTVAITSTWTNATANLCVSVNGASPTLISQDNKTSGTRTDTPNWISLNTTYTFTLYNRPSQNPACSGASLSSCQIDTHFPLITPRP